MAKKRRSDYDIKYKRIFKRKIKEFVRKVVERERGLVCKYCGSDSLIKYGLSNAKQRYQCQDCVRIFTDNSARPFMQSPVMEIGSALSGYYRGMSLKNIGEHLEQQFNHNPSKSTVYRWLMRYTKKAINEADKHVPNVGTVWIADETSIKIEGKKYGYWFWDIIDAKTRFLLASHISKTRTIKDAQILMEKAKERARKTPDLVFTDHLAAYIDGIELTFGGDTKHVKTKPFKTGINTNFIERFHGTLKERTKVMRGLLNEKTARLLLDGWLVHYNFFRPHQSLKGKTPAEKAEIQFPYKDWLSVASGNISQPVMKIPHIRHRDRSPIRINMVKIPRMKRKKIKKLNAPRVGVLG